MKALSKVNFIVIHCADTPSNMDVKISDLHRWHVEENGWSDIGYHYFIKRNGSLHDCRDDSLQGAHCKSVNDSSLAICIEGGFNGVNSFTTIQKKSLRALINKLKKSHPNAAVVGHSHFDNKACPSFNVVEWYESNKDKSIFPFLLR